MHFADLDIPLIIMCFTVSGTPQDSHVGWSLSSNIGTNVLGDNDQFDVC